MFAVLAIGFAAFMQSSCPGTKTANNSTVASTTPALANANTLTAPTAKSGMKLFVPSYFSENQFSGNNGGNGGDWDKLISALKPGDVLIINPNSGPTYDPKDEVKNKAGQAAFKKIVIAAKSKYKDQPEGIVILGYVHTLDGKNNVRPVDEITKEIDIYQKVFELKDIFFDEFTDTPNTPNSTFPYYSEICKYVKTNGGRTTLNPGAVAKEPFAKITDWIVVFESPFDSYKQYLTDHWEWSLKPEYHDKIVHLILGTDEKYWKPVIKRARDANSAYAYVTDFSGGKEWDKLASYWDEEVVEIRK